MLDDSHIATRGVELTVGSKCIKPITRPVTYQPGLLTAARSNGAIYVVHGFTLNTSTPTYVGVYTRATPLQSRHPPYLPELWLSEAKGVRGLHSERSDAPPVMVDFSL